MRVEIAYKGKRYHGDLVIPKERQDPATWGERVGFMIKHDSGYMLMLENSVNIDVPDDKPKPRTLKMRDIDDMFDVTK